MCTKQTLYFAFFAAEEFLKKNIFEIHVENIEITYEPNKLLPQALTPVNKNKKAIFFW